MSTQDSLNHLISPEKIAENSSHIPNDEEFLVDNIITPEVIRNNLLNFLTSSNLTQYNKTQQSQPASFDSIAFQPDFYSVLRRQLIEERRNNHEQLLDAVISRNKTKTSIDSTFFNISPELYARSYTSAIETIEEQVIAPILTIQSNIKETEIELSSVNKNFSSTKSQVLKLKSDLCCIDATREFILTLKHLENLIEKIECDSKKTVECEVTQNTDLINFYTKNLNTKFEFFSIDSTQIYERISRLFSRISKFNIFDNKNTGFNSFIHKKLLILSNKFKKLLQNELVSQINLQKSNTEIILRSFSAYEDYFCSHQNIKNFTNESLLNRTISERIVKPLLDQKLLSISAKKIRNSCSEIFDKLVESLEKRLGESLLASSALMESLGYDFVKDSIWPSICTAVKQQSDILFPARYPNIFHRNYTATFDFFLRIYSQNTHKSKLNINLHSEISLNLFARQYLNFSEDILSSIKLSNYFMMRRQEIIEYFENHLMTGCQSEQENCKENFEKGSVTPSILQEHKFILPETRLLQNSINQCQSFKHTFLPDLSIRFLKLTLQLVSRYLEQQRTTNTLSNTTENSDKKVKSNVKNNTLKMIKQHFSVAYDFALLKFQISGFVCSDKLVKQVEDSNKIYLLKHIEIILSNLSISTDSKTSEPKFHQLLYSLFDLLLNEILVCGTRCQSHALKSLESLCSVHLEEVARVKDVYQMMRGSRFPKEPSPYVDKIFKPLEKLVQTSSTSEQEDKENYNLHFFNLNTHENFLNIYINSKIEGENNLVFQNLLVQLVVSIVEIYCDKIVSSIEYLSETQQSLNRLKHNPLSYQNLKGRSSEKLNLNRQLSTKSYDTVKDPSESLTDLQKINLQLYIDVQYFKMRIDELIFGENNGKCSFNHSCQQKLDKCVSEGREIYDRIHCIDDIF